MAILAVFPVSAACGAVATGNGAVEQAYQQHRSQVEVTVDGIVVAIFPDRVGKSGRHQQFLVRLPSGLTVEIENNIDIAPRAPVKEGDPVVLHGEYIWQPNGGLIHFTHRDPRGRHEGGWILVGGKRYE